MPLGIGNLTSISMDNITNIANFTTPTDFLINVNHFVYNDYAYFIFLWVFAAILFLAGQGFKNQPLTNALYSGAAVSVIAFFSRGITRTLSDGTTLALLNDYQMWSFPLITILLAVIAFASAPRN